MAHVVTHAVVDSGAFIRNAPLKDLASNVYTVKEVVGEIRDKTTLQRLQVLPYDLIFREPAAECIKAVTDFTKLTGDYPSLSATDLRVMALAYQLEKEHVGTSHIKTVPNRKIEFTTTARALEKPTDIAGFYLGPSSAAKAVGRVAATTDERSSAVDADSSAAGADDARDVAEGDCVGVCSQPASAAAATDGSLDVTSLDCSLAAAAADNVLDPDPAPLACSLDYRAESGVSGGELAYVRNGKSDCCSHESDSLRAEEQQQGQGAELEARDSPRRQSSADDCRGNEEEAADGGDVDGSDGDQDDDDDDEGWITPSNLKQVQAEMRSQSGDTTKTDSVVVGCVTTDFAMQNVLIQMGLNVVSCDGLIIKRARSYVLRCAACFKITANVTKQFCYHCGNKMLQKVSATVNEDGSVSYYLSRRKPITTRGLKFSLPMPKGGKHAVNPRLAEDQPAPQQRASKMAQQRSGKDVFADDYVAQASPFAVHDVVSRAARLGIRNGGGEGPKQQQQPEETYYWNRRNPNEVRKHGRRK